MANAGVIEKLEEENLRPDFIAGSSMGAIVGAIYALGHPPSVFRDITRSIRLTNLIKLSETALQQGLHGGLFRQRLQENVETLISDAAISDCMIPFTCIAGRIVEPILWEKFVLQGFTQHAMKCVEKHVFPPETKLRDALTATSAIPVLFSPAKVNGDSFIDLCTFGAIPARTVRDVFCPDIIIATDTTPSYPFLQKYGPLGVRQFIKAASQSREESRAACDLIMKPKLPASMLRFDKGEEFMEAGKKAMEDALPQLRELLKMAKQPA